MRYYRKFLVTTSKSGETFEIPSDGPNVPAHVSYNTETGEITAIWSAPGSHTELEDFTDE